MSKLAQIVVGETASEKLKEAQSGGAEPYLKKETGRRNQNEAR